MDGHLRAVEAVVVVVVVNAVLKIPGKYKLWNRWSSGLPLTCSLCVQILAMSKVKTVKSAHKGIFQYVT